jgi:hypothetical protein
VEGRVTRVVRPEVEAVQAVFLVALPVVLAERAAPGADPAVLTAGGPLPLRLGRQVLPRPGGVELRVGPAHEDDGMALDPVDLALHVHPVVGHRQRVDRELRAHGELLLRPVRPGLAAVLVHVFAVLVDDADVLPVERAPPGLVRPAVELDRDGGEGVEVLLHLEDRLVVLEERQVLGVRDLEPVEEEPLHLDLVLRHLDRGVLAEGRRKAAEEPVQVPLVRALIELAALDERHAHRGRPQLRGCLDRGRQLGRLRERGAGQQRDEKSAGQETGDGHGGSSQGSLGTGDSGLRTGVDQVEHAIVARGFGVVNSRRHPRQNGSVGLPGENTSSGVGTAFRPHILGERA